MTKKITISIPDDVAELLTTVDNVSAYVTESVRRRMRSEQTRESLRRQGFAITDEGVARWRERLAAHDAHATPERFAASRNRLSKLARGLARGDARRGVNIEVVLDTLPTFRTSAVSPT
jgi:hypothetical protein